MSKKIVTIAFLLLFAMAILGVGYGAWQELLTVQGSLTTGQFDIAFDDYNDHEGVLYEGLAKCEIAYTEDYKEVLITVTNGYPGYTCGHVFHITNNGTVPAVIKPPVVVWGHGWVEIGDVSPRIDGADWPEDTEGLVFPGDYVKCGWMVKVPENADEGVTQTFKINFTGVQ